MAWYENRSPRGRAGNYPSNPLILGGADKPGSNRQTSDTAHNPHAICRNSDSVNARVDGTDDAVLMSSK